MNTLEDNKSDMITLDWVLPSRNKHIQVITITRTVQKLAYTSHWSNTQGLF